MIKYGKRKNLQRYQCSECKFTGTLTSLKSRRDKQVWENYWDNNSLYRNLKVSSPTVQRIIENQGPVIYPDIYEKRIVLGIDTTFFKNFGIMLFRNQRYQTNLFWREVEYETVQGYVAGIEVLEARDYRIIAIVCDGKPGLVRTLKKRGILVQICQWHEKRVIERKTTRNPKTIAGQEMLILAKILAKTSRDKFEREFGKWKIKWKKYLEEKSVNMQTGEVEYTHERLRSARRTLERDMNELFTFEEYEGLEIPNTNNSLEGIFGWMKPKLKIHRGLKKHRKLKLINQMLMKKPTQTFN